MINKIEEFDEEKQRLYRLKKKKQQKEKEVKITNYDISDDYDPYIDYRRKNNLLTDKSIQKVKQNYVNINSTHRNKYPSNIVSDVYYLEQNPVQFTNGTNFVKFLVSPNNFAVGDRISVDNVDTEDICLRTRTGTSNGVSFEDGSNFMTIYHNHGIPLSYNDTILTVKVSGIKNNLDMTYINNIPLININKVHTICLKRYTNDTALSDRFYIDVGDNFIGSYVFEEYNFYIKYLFIAGIELSSLNANYPVSINRITGYHTIYTKADDGVVIYLPNQSIQTKSAGGNNVVLSKVSNIIPGFSNSNNYIIELPKIFTNITRVELIGTEFINSADVIKTDSNDMFYWQNRDDGNHVYSAQISSGFYTIDELIEELTTNINSVDRISKITSSEYISSLNESKHDFRITHNKNTDKIEIISYKNFVFYQPFISISPMIEESADLDNFTTNTVFEITVLHVNHGLELGDVITITDAESHLGVPASTLNASHIITRIESKDRYSFNLPKFNIEAIRISTLGGNNVRISIRDVFRVRCDLDNSVCGLLGFRDIGESHAVTPYATINTNYSMYENDVLYDTSGNTMEYTNNRIKLTTDTYIVMSITEFNTILDTGKTPNSFAKIQLSNTRNEILYNTFKSTPKIFSEPLSELYQLNISFYDKDGNLFNFNGLEHSFMLEITTTIDNTYGTNVNKKTGRINTNKNNTVIISR